MRQVILALLVGVSTAAAAETGAAKPAAHGRFESGGVAVEVSDAYAFRGKSSMGDESVIVVAITNGGFPREVIDRWWDRKQVLEQKFRPDNDTVLVYLEFSPSGEYQGLSYYIGSGLRLLQRRGAVHGEARRGQARRRAQVQREGPHL
jgi:hypothetical protein